MKLKVKLKQGQNEVEVYIICERVDRRLDNLISRIRLYDLSISGTKDGETHILYTEDVVYFESLEGRLVICTDDDIYESDTKLYEIEDYLSDTPFVRINKSTIINIGKIDRVRVLINSKIEVFLKTKERVFVSRTYLKDFKSKIEHMGGKNNDE